MTTVTRPYPKGIRRPTDNSFWRVPLRKAVRYGHLEVLKVLLTEGFSNDNLVRGVLNMAVRTDAWSGEYDADRRVPIIDWILTIYTPSVEDYLEFINDLREQAEIEDMVTFNDGRSRVLRCIVQNAHRHHSYAGFNEMPEFQPVISDASNSTSGA